jgi:phospholipase/carboxylesterase
MGTIVATTAPRISHVTWSDAELERAGKPLVVALHGRGADESSMASLAPYLPSGVSVAAPRGPVAADGGWTWFANRGIGRPIEESIQATAGALFAWLDEVSEQHSSVTIAGFSGGTAMAGGLILAEPSRFAAAVLLSGTLPWDAGFDTPAGRLASVPVFWGFDDADAVIPRDLVGRSEAWLRDASGAELAEHKYPGMGHSISLQELSDVSAFISANNGSQ